MSSERTAVPEPEPGFVDEKFILGRVFSSIFAGRLPDDGTEQRGTLSCGKCFKSNQMW